MILLASIFAVLTAAFAAKAAKLTRELEAARRKAAEFRRPSAPPPPAHVRQFECRIESRGLLWFPVLTARDEEKVIVGVSSGLPHCVRCQRALKLAPDRAETWNCAGCGDARPEVEADLMATDRVLGECLSVFFQRHPDYAPAPGLTGPKCEPVTAVERDQALSALTSMLV